MKLDLNHSRRCLLGSLGNPWRLCVRAAALTALIFVIGGCGAVGLGGRTGPKDTEEHVGPGKVTPTEVQSEIMSFADTFNGMTAQAWNQAVQGIQSRANTGGANAPTQADAIRATRAALEIRLAMATSTTTIAASPNPVVAVADMVTVVTLERMVLQDAQTERLFGAQGQELLVNAYKEHEERVWRIAQLVYTAEQCEDLRQQIDDWRSDHLDQRYVAQTRLEDFAKDRQSYMTGEKKGTSVLSILGIDPLASLDPTVREVKKTRMLGERTFYYLSRSPALMKLQVESLAASLLRTPEVKSSLESADRASRAIEAAAQVAAGLQTQFVTEREATLDALFANISVEREKTLSQFFNGLTAQREALLTDLNTKQGDLQTTVRDLHSTVDAATKLSDSLTTTIREARSLAQTVSPAETLKPKITTEDRDFLTDYRGAIEQTGQTVERLNVLAQRLEQIINSPSIQKQVATIETGVATVEESTQRVVDRAFYRLLILAAVFPCATVLSIVLFRRLRTPRSASA